MLKESKIRVLENFYALDYIFFGKPVNEVELCCPIVKEEYLSVKGALLSVYVEMLKMLDHNPTTVQESVNGEILNTMAKKSAGIARENSEKIVTTSKSRMNIKESLQDELKSDPEADVSGIVEKAIRSKAFGLAVDNLMVARALSEANTPEKMNEWEGRIVEDSYKILRDSLVESAYQILYDVTDDESKKNLTKEEEELEEAMNPAKAQKKIQKFAEKIKNAKFMMSKGCMRGSDPKQVEQCRRKFDAAIKYYDARIQRIKVKAQSESTEVTEASPIAVGAILGAITGLIAPVPFGAVGGAAVGALAGWGQKNRVKVEGFCTQRFKDDAEGYKSCMRIGSKAMRSKLNQAKEKIKKAKAKK